MTPSTLVGRPVTDPVPTRTSFSSLPGPLCGMGDTTRDVKPQKDTYRFRSIVTNLAYQEYTRPAE